MDCTQTGVAHPRLIAGRAQAAEVGASLDRGVRADPTAGRRAQARTAARAGTGLASTGVASVALAAASELVPALVASRVDAGTVGTGGAGAPARQPDGAVGLSIHGSGAVATKSSVSSAGSCSRPEQAAGGGPRRGNSPGGPAHGVMDFADLSAPCSMDGPALEPAERSPDEEPRSRMRDADFIE